MELTHFIIKFPHRQRNFKMYEDFFINDYYAYSGLCKLISKTSSHSQDQPIGRYVD